MTWLQRLIPDRTIQTGWQRLTLCRGTEMRHLRMRPATVEVSGEMANELRKLSGYINHKEVLGIPPGRMLLRHIDKKPDGTLTITFYILADYDWNQLPFAPEVENAERNQPEDALFPYYDFNTINETDVENGLTE